MAKWDCLKSERDKCGAPRSMDDRGERWLGKCVRVNRHAAVEQQHTTHKKQGASNSVSQATVQRTLLSLVLRSRRLVHIAMLAAVHWEQRLEFARQYRN
ncbi:transposable element Tcb1 transposase [Trichonephila clavipes]|nr:transposable element Tcb1 transposase [Trichonephila clavipes]